MFKKVESCINQNNAVNIYENYFEDSEPAPLVDRSSSRTVYVYRDVDTPTVSSFIALHLRFFVNFQFSFSVKFLTCLGHLMVALRLLSLTVI